MNEAPIQDLLVVRLRCFSIPATVSCLRVMWVKRTWVYGQLITVEGLNEAPPRETRERGSQNRSECTGEVRLRCGEFRPANPLARLHRYGQMRPASYLCVLSARKPETERSVQPGNSLNRSADGQRNQFRFFTFAVATQTLLPDQS